MGFAQGNRWWERWQLHALVAGSLFVQFFLLLAAVLRKRRTPPWFRFLTWAAYISSDALAIYALALLFSRHKMPGGSSSSPPPSLPRGTSGLEVLLAPVLLLHLGGRDGITAYSIQDNELWRRRFLIAGSQVAVAVYVFRKTWPPGADKRLLVAAILLFLPGIFKCLDKPWALKKSAFNTMSATVDGQQVSNDKPCQALPAEESQSEQAKKNLDIEAGSSSSKPTKPKAWSSLVKAIKCCSSQEPHKLSSEEQRCSNEKVHSPKAFVRAASRVYAEPFCSKIPLPTERLSPHDPYHLFVDLNWSYSARLDNLRCLWLRNDNKLHLVVRSGLSRSFDRFYSNVGKGYLGTLIRAMLMAMTFVATGLFTAVGQGGGYADADIKAINFLLWSTAALELVSFSAIATTCLRLMPEPWPDQVPQCNLIGYLVHREKHRRRWRLAALLGFDVYADWLWCAAPSRALPSSSSITQLIHTHITDQWIKYIKEDIFALLSYQEFSDSRGKWTLDKEGWSKLSEDLHIKDPTPKYSIASTVQRPFDQSVIIWHLATDLCFFNQVGNGREEEEDRRCSREISNYMVYLLLVKPEMLVPGARRRVFMVAYEQVRQTLVKDYYDSLEDDDDDLANKKLPRAAKDDMARKIMQKVDPTDATGPGLVQEACVLAKELMKLAKRPNEGEEKMWRVIRGVWVEMLSFSASRCRGYLHAKSLGTGGEYLSYVWLLRAYMGLETLGDRIQRSEE
nr:unnamed protein product [Digitaria exilis]